MTYDTIQNFRAAMLDAGLTPTDVIETDGQLQRD